MRAGRLGIAGALVLLAGCGSSASVANLRCDAPCQSTQDPFLLNLLVDLDDPMKVVQGGQLVVAIAGKDAATYQLDTLAHPRGQGTPTLAFPLPLHFATVVNGQQFKVEVRATNGAEETNTADLLLQVSL